MTAIHHTPLPEEFSMRTNTEDGWELLLRIERVRPMEGGPSVDTLHVVVTASLWTVSRFRKRQSVVAIAGIDLIWDSCGKLREELAWADTELEMIGLGKARTFLQANYTRLDAIVQLDDLIRSGECKCSDCRYGTGWPELQHDPSRAERS